MKQYLKPTIQTYRLAPLMLQTISTISETGGDQRSKQQYVEEDYGWDDDDDDTVGYGDSRQSLHPTNH